MPPERGERGARSILAALLLCLCGLASAAPRIGLVTMQPGDAYWARFGHNAILVEDEAGRRIHYNYGYFDFEEPNFLLNFLRGKMEYRLVALPAQHDLEIYAGEGRGVSVQWLAMDPAAARKLAGFLAWNARPENARYQYDYFTANCSTRVRDALDEALGGVLSRQFAGRSRGLTYRWESLRLGAPQPWLFLGMHAGLGPFADQPLSRWDESFVPMHLAEAVREATLADGSPLLVSEAVLLPHRTGLPPDERPWVLPWFVLAGALLGAGIALPELRARRMAPGGAALRRTGATVASLCWLLAGLGGLLLAGLWGFTDHRAAWGNENLLLFNPLVLLLLGAVPALWRGRAAPHWLRGVAWLVLVSALVAVFLKFLPWRVQDNLDWIAFWLPIHAAAVFALRRPSTPLP